MAVRRKSNWYIYLISFLVTMAFVLLVIFGFRWYLFPEESAEAGLTSAGELSDSFKPTAEDSFSIIGMLSDAPEDMPTLFVLGVYNAVESSVTLIPVPSGISIGSEGRNLTNVYAAQGGQGVSNAVSNAMGLRIDGYFKLDRAGFDGVVSSIGNVQYDVPKTIIITDGREIDSINAGSQLLSAEKLFRYIMLADFDNGESYRFNMVGNVLCELINQNYSYADSMLLDTWASQLLGSSDTNITGEFYSAKKAALLNTIMYGNAPAEYYVPYGNYGDDGSFTISETSITTIRQKAGIE